MRRLLPFLALAACALAGCSHRERANPFDPRNPGTGGGPSGFVALAGDGRVDLHWNLVLNSGLMGYRLYRRTAAETSFRAITTVLAPTVTHYLDAGLLNGLDHHYQLFFVFADGERGEPATDTATPGTARPWIVDFSAGALHRLTPDGRHVAFTSGGLRNPVSVGVDSVTGKVWVSDYGAQQVLVLDPSTGVKTTIPGVASPGRLAVEPAAGSAWVCDELGARLYEFNADGDQLGAAIEPIDTPIGLAIDPFDGAVWVAERGASHVRKYAANHSLLWNTPVDRPSRVAVDSVTRRGWVTSFEAGRVFRLSPSGAVEDSISGFAGPLGIAVDARNGRIWVADALGNRLVALDRNGDVKLLIAGLPEVRDVSVDAGSGEVWVVAPGSGEVVRITATGLVLRRLGGFSEPYGVSVDPGTR
jgi:DNA-binding beta-propeller fold protein YncE